MTVLNILILWTLFGLAVCAPLLFLDHVLDFDVSGSPAWQVGLSHLLLIALGLWLYAMAVCLFFPRVPGGRWIVPGLGVLLLAGVLMLGWWQGGAYWGFRGEQVQDLLSLFAVASPSVVILLRLVFILSGRAVPSGASV